MQHRDFVRNQVHGPCDMNAVSLTLVFWYTDIRLLATNSLC